MSHTISSQLFATVVAMVVFMIAVVMVVVVAVVVLLREWHLVVHIPVPRKEQMCQFVCGLT